jgi:hypothetical protein
LQYSAFSLKKRPRAMASLMGHASLKVAMNSRTTVAALRGSLTTPD